MNDYSNCSNGKALLKDFYSKGPTAQINSKPEMIAIRKKRDLAAKKQSK